MPRTSRNRIACATRSRPRGGTSATSRTLPATCSSAVREPRPRVRAAAGARGAARAARGARAVGKRAVKSESWLRELERPRVQTKLERELSEAAGTRDHQGVVAWCEPYRYADAFELAGASEPLLVVLDQVTDPRNLGAVIRSAEGAGATGIVLPADNSARVTAAVA